MQVKARESRRELLASVILIPLLRLFMCLGGGPVTAKSGEQLFKEYAAGPRGVTAMRNLQITSREAFAKECRKSLEWFSLP